MTIRIINGKLGLTSSRILRCDCCGHTVRVSTNLRDLVPSEGAPNIAVEDLGYGFQTKVAAGTFPPKHLEEQAVPAELPGTNDPFTGRGYQAARGCAPAPAGAPKAEDVIALGRGKQAEATIERLNPLLAGGEHHEGADPSATCPECHADRRVLDKKMRSGIWDIIPYYDARASITSCPACREWWLKGGHITEATSGTLAKAAVSISLRVRAERPGVPGAGPMKREGSMKTIEEAAEIQGITMQGDGLRIHFSPIPNWYSFQGVDCPRCDQSIEWKWNGKLPGFTTPQTIAASGVTPTVAGAKLVEWGHRYMGLECNSCGTKLFAENYD